MTKVAIKKREYQLLSVGFITLWTFFSKLGFEKLTESVLGKRGRSGKAFSHWKYFRLISSSATFVVENALRTSNALIGQFKQRPNTLLPSADTVGRGLKELAEKILSIRARPPTSRIVSIRQKS